MSFISKLFGRTPTVVAPPAAPTPPPKAPKPDRSLEIAAEEARLNEAIQAGLESLIAEFVGTGTSTRIRQRAADAIQDPERIRELIRVSRGKDNAVYKILTTKRDAVLAAEKAAAALQAELEAMAAAIARHARLPFDAVYEATLNEHAKRWQTLGSQAPAALKDGVEADLAKARAVVLAHHEAIAAERQRREAAAEAARLADEAAAQARREREEAAQETASRLASERAEQDAKAQSESESIRELVSLLRQMQNALDRGGSARAARLREGLTPKLSAIDAATLPAWFQRQLALADEQLMKLKDWHEFTVAPKRIELIERMHSLIGAEIAPEQLAMHVRKLQDEWRTLHRGAAGDDDSAENAKFKELANQAYEPCKVHFALKAAQRAENKEKREAILVRLGEYSDELDAEAPNWRRVIHTLSDARREWRQYAPVDQEIAEALQAQFKAAMDGISAKLDAEFGRNVDLKRGLISEAANLVQLEDLRQAIDSAKTLQRTWKTIGIVPRDVDNPLWEEFRGHCNAVFERSAAESVAFAAQLEAAVVRAQAIIAELERIAQLTGTELREGVKTLESLQQEFDGLELPRSNARELHHQAHRMSDRCHEAVHLDRARAVNQAWADVFTVASDIRGYGWALHSQASEDAVSALQGALNERVAALAAAPKFARTALERQWAKMLAGEVSADVVANEATLRLLCIRAELATDSVTPADDQDRRREYQMQRLLQSRNLGADFEPVNMDDLTLEWLAVGAVDPSIDAALNARFEQCRAVVASRQRAAD